MDCTYCGHKTRNVCRWCKEIWDQNRYVCRGCTDPKSKMCLYHFKSTGYSPAQKSLSRMQQKYENNYASNHSISKERKITRTLIELKMYEFKENLKRKNINPMTKPATILEHLSELYEYYDTKDKKDKE